MICKLPSGEYRLYSRRRDPKTGTRRNLGTFATREEAESTNARSSTSSATDPSPFARHVPDAFEARPSMQGALGHAGLSGALQHMPWTGRKQSPRPKLPQAPPVGIDATVRGAGAAA
jgi:hypothetical protein